MSTVRTLSDDALKAISEKIKKIRPTFDLLSTYITLQHLRLLSQVDVVGGGLDCGFTILFSSAKMHHPAFEGSMDRLTSVVALNILCLDPQISGDLMFTATKSKLGILLNTARQREPNDKDGQSELRKAIIAEFTAKTPRSVVLECLKLLHEA